jgi:hypothetical protein
MTWIKACLLKRFTPNLPPEALTTPKVARQDTNTAKKECLNWSSKRRSCRRPLTVGEQRAFRKALSEANTVSHQPAAVFATKKMGVEGVVEMILKDITFTAQ